PKNLRIEDVHRFAQSVGENPYLDSVSEKTVEHGSGTAYLQMNLREGLFNQILAEQCGTEIKSDAHLLSLLRELVTAKREYDHVAQALQAVRETGYGLVPPLLEEMTLQEPEIMKQGGRFGVRLRASAPSLHLIRVDIQTEVSPVVGTEQQSEEMIRYLMDGFEQDPQKLWGSNLFGKPLSDLVREGLSNKLMHMPADTQLKIQQTLEKIINEGTGGMVCILL
ncbi:MAG: stage IV sporulation protein A, partial [Candidatus Ventricola sp.]